MLQVTDSAIAKDVTVGQLCIWLLTLNERGQGMDRTLLRPITSRVPAHDQTYPLVLIKLRIH